MSLTKVQVRDMRANLQKMLDKHYNGDDCSAKVGNASFDGGSVTFKLIVSTVGADGELETPEAAAFKRNADLFGLKPTDLNRTFVIGTSRYKVTGLKPHSPKFPVITENVATGKSYKWPSETVVSAMSREGAVTS